MGIKQGSPELVQAIAHGMYNRHAKVYDISVDGENLQYKGYVGSVLCQANAEALIAANAHDYLSTTIALIEQWIGCKPRNVNIYMDGPRVMNKESRSKLTFDVRSIRSFFAYHCTKSRWNIIENGESELQMYLNRDRSVNLNVFVTNDTDMISICYGHEPWSTAKVLNIESQDATALPTCNTLSSISSSSHISDLNRVYMQNSKVDISDVSSVESDTSRHVFDSCLWVNTNKQILNFIGFDYIADKLNYDTQIFRVLIALCGTDFTPGILTRTQIHALLVPNHENINRFTAAVGLSGTSQNISSIVAALLAISFRGGGLINRTRYAPHERVDVEKFIDAIRIYCEYIATGNMVGTLERQNGGLIVHHYIYAMLGQEPVFKARSLRTWFTNSTIDKAIENCLKYLGTFDPKTCLETTALAATKKRMRKKQQDAQETGNSSANLDAHTAHDNRFYGPISSIHDFDTGATLYTNTQLNLDGNNNNSLVVPNDAVVVDCHNYGESGFDAAAAAAATSVIDANLTAKQFQTKCDPMLDFEDASSLDLTEILDWEEQSKISSTTVSVSSSPGHEQFSQSSNKGLGLDSVCFQSILQMLDTPEK